MRTRPWPLVLLAMLQVLSPIGTVLFNSWALGVKPIYVISWIFQSPFLKIFETVALMPIAGIAIYQMKSWSYVLFFLSMAWSLASNLRNWNYASQNYSLWMMLLVYIFQIGLAIYFMIPSVRKTFLDSRVRWWEAKRRYLLEIPVALNLAGTKERGRMINLAEGGMLAEFQLALKEHSQIQLSFNVFSAVFSTPGEVVYTMDRGGGKKAYGIRFLHTPETHRKFRNLAHALELIGIRDRDQNLRQPWYLELWDWAITLVRSGRGWIPDFKSPRK